jgi:hypothetical protein
VAGRQPAAGWLDHWLPGWDALLAALIQLLQAVLRGVAAWIPWLLGAVWALGSLLTLALAGLLHWAIRVGSRPPSTVQGPAPTAPGRGLSAAGHRTCLPDAP